MPETEEMNVKKKPDAPTPQDDWDKFDEQIFEMIYFSGCSQSPCK